MWKVPPVILGNERDRVIGSFHSVTLCFWVGSGEGLVFILLVYSYVLSFLPEFLLELSWKGWE